MKYFTPSGFYIVEVIFYNNFIPSGLKNHHSSRITISLRD